MNIVRCWQAIGIAPALHAVDLRRDLVGGQQVVVGS